MCLQNTFVPHFLGRHCGEVFRNRLNAEGTEHLTRDQPLFDAGHTIDVATWQSEGISRVHHTYRAQLEAKPERADMKCLRSRVLE